MVGIYVMLIVTIALVAGVSASTYFQLSSTQASLMVQQNQVRIQVVSGAITSGITTFNGRDVVPLASPSSGDYPARVPSYAVFNKTTGGRDIVYCPIVFADTFNANGDLVNERQPGSGASPESYPVEVATRGNRSYMVAGYPTVLFGKTGDQDRADAAKELNASGIFGFLLSPDPRLDGDLSCSDVQKVSDGNYIIRGGTVQPFYGSIKDRPATTYVIETGGTEQLGEDEKPVGTIKDALQLISRYDQANATIVLDGNVTVSGEERTLLEDTVFGRSIKFFGKTASTVTFASSGNLSLSLKGDVFFENLTLQASGGSIGIDALPSSRIILKSTDVNFVRVSGGSVHIEGNSHIVTSSGSAVDAAGGSITFDIPGTSASILSSSADPVFLISGGRVLANQSIYAEGPGPLYAAGSPKSVDKAFGAKVYLNGAEQVGLSSPYHREQQTCADGSTSCEASCNAGEVVAWGECASGNNSPLAGFYADTDGQTYTCEWSTGPVPVSTPRAAVVCTTPQH